MNEITEESLTEDIKNLVMTCYLYLQIKSKPANPFVRKLGESEEEISLMKVMEECTLRLLPLVDDESVEPIINEENKGLMVEE